MKLRALEPEDLELLYTIENDPAMWDVGASSVPFSRYDLREYILRQQHDIYADRQLRMVACNADGKAVGLVDLFNFSPPHLRAEVGYAILPQYRGRGYALEALNHLSVYAADTLRLHQLYAVVADDNTASADLLRKAGFSRETPLRDWLRTPSGYKSCLALFKILSEPCGL